VCDFKSRISAPQNTLSWYFIFSIKLQAEDGMLLNATTFGMRGPAAPVATEQHMIGCLWN
jgi:hypothetical protein